MERKSEWKEVKREMLNGKSSSMNIIKSIILFEDDKCLSQVYSLDCDGKWIIFSYHFEHANLWTYLCQEATRRKALFWLTFEMNSWNNNHFASIYSAWLCIRIIMVRFWFLLFDSPPSCPYHFLNSNSSYFSLPILKLFLHSLYSDLNKQMMHYSGCFFSSLGTHRHTVEFSGSSIEVSVPDEIMNAKYQLNAAAKKIDAKNISQIT